MPRAYDPSLPGGGLPITHNPLNRMRYNVIPEKLNLEDILEDVEDLIVQQLENFLFPAIEAVTGIDLSVFLPLLDEIDLDFSSPEAFLGSLADAMIAIGTAFLGPNSPLNALNLFNLIPTNILGLIPYSHVGEGNPNLLANPTFEGVESVQGSGLWFWDGAIGHNGPGSAYTTANGADRQLVSNAIPVSENQELDLSIWAKWAGLNVGSNLVISPGFEDASVSRPCFAPQPGDTYKVIYSTEQKHSGTQSIKIHQNPAASSNSGFALLPVESPNYAYPWNGLADYVTVAPGEQYQIEVWIYPDSANSVSGYSTANIQCVFHDSTGVNGDSYVNVLDSGSVPPRGQWTKLTVTFAIPAGYDRMWPDALVYNDNAGTNVYYWDDAILRKVPAGSLAQGVTYTQSGVYPGQAAADYVNMNDGTADETLHTATPRAPTTYVRADCGSVKTISRIVIGYDYLNHLVGGFGHSYLAGCAVEGSNDGSSWTAITTTPWYPSTGSSDGLVSVPINQAWRYIRVARHDNEYLAITEFRVYALPDPTVKLQVLRMLNYAHVGVDDLLAPPSVPSDQDWTKVQAPYTVPAGCDMICMQITVASSVTSGTVWIDDGNVHKTGLMEIPWVKGLPEGLQKLVADIQKTIDTIFQALTQTDWINNEVEALVALLQNIPNIFVGGVGGPPNIGESLQRTWDQLIAGFVGSPGGGGAGLADLFGVGQDISSWASLGRYGWDVLGIRNNKPLDQGLMATSNSNFSLGRVGMQASAPTINVTQSVSALAFMRMAESNDKGVVSWLGGGNANVTACYVNIWQMNATNGDMTLVHRSPNIVGNLGASMGWVIYQHDLLLTHAADIYGIEITIVGSGTHQVAGTTAWLPPHPTVFPKGYATTRNSGTANPALGTVIPAASVVYSNNIPWIEWGIRIGPESSAHTDETFLLNTVGAGTTPIPSWCNFVDVIALGGGAGGGGGGLYGVPQGNGGNAGQWATGTWARGTDFTGATIIDFTIPNGGNRGATAGGGNTAGGNTVVSIPGHTITGAGGAINNGHEYGSGAGSITYRGQTYSGGGQQNMSGAAGAVPGGGGASGPDFAGGNGGVGAHGAAMLVFRQT